MKSSLTYYTSLVFLICCMALIITSVDIFKAYVPLKGITILIPMLALVVMCFKVLASKRSFVFLLFFSFYVSIAGAYGEKSIFSILYVFLLPVILYFVIQSFNDNKKLYFILIFLIPFSIALIPTGIILQQYPLALRSQSTDLNFDYTFFTVIMARYGLINYHIIQGVCVLIPILTYAFKNIKGKVRFLPLLLILLIFAIQIEGTVTTSLVLGLVMFFFCLFSKRINFKWIIAALLIVAFLFQTGLISDMLGYSSNMLADNQDLQQRVLELKDVIDGNEAEGDLGSRVDKYNLTKDAIFDNPIFGNSKSNIGGHAYFLDMLVYYGIWGMLLFVSFIITFYFYCKNSMSISIRPYYTLGFLSFVIFGSFKNMAGIDYWMLTFCILPLLCEVLDSRLNNA